MKDYAAAIWIKGAKPLGIEFKAVNNKDAVDHAFTWAQNQQWRKMSRTEQIKADGSMVAGYIGDDRTPAFIQVNAI